MFALLDHLKRIIRPRDRTVHGYCPRQTDFCRIVAVLFALVLIIETIRRQSSSCSISTEKTSCVRSMIESDGFFCEQDQQWNERKSVYQQQEKENIIVRPNTYFFGANWEPNFHCRLRQRIGVMADGGKWICDPNRVKLRRDCLVYSFGSSGDFSFEVHLKKSLPHCEIYSFDKARYLCPDDVCHFRQVTAGDGIQPNQSSSWSDVVRQLNHTHRFIEIAKIDIEGSEYDFVTTILDELIHHKPRQLIIELHPTNVTAIARLFVELRKHRYVIFSKENNPEAGPFFYEYGFLRLNEAFFQV